MHSVFGFGRENQSERGGRLTGCVRCSKTSGRKSANNSKGGVKMRYSIASMIIIGIIFLIYIALLVFAGLMLWDAIKELRDWRK